jgi:LysM repeat protein
MNDDSEVRMDDALSEGGTYSPRRKRNGSGKNKFLRILLVVILVLIFAGGIFYFLSKRPTGGEVSSLHLKVTALGQKTTGLEKQLAELQGQISTVGKDPAFLQQVNALAQRVEALEKREQAADESKAKPSPSSKRAVSTEKRYHTVQKGETLFGISKKYGISVEELRKQNNLSKDQPLRTGQKLLVSPRH